MEFFYSFRMNDIHLSAHRAAWLWSDFRKANLHLLQGQVDREWFEKKFVPWMNGEVEEHPLVKAIEPGWKFFFPWNRRRRSPPTFGPGPRSTLGSRRFATITWAWFARPAGVRPGRNRI